MINTFSAVFFSISVLDLLISVPTLLFEVSVVYYLKLIESNLLALQ